MSRYCLLLLLISTNTRAQTLQIEKGLVTRDDTGSSAGFFAAFGPGQLTLTGTDSYGRTVAVLPNKVTLKDKALPFEIPLKGAVSLLNYLEELILGKNYSERAGRAEFIVTPNEPWDDYEVIMCYPYKPEQQAALRELGVTAGQIQNVPSRNPEG